MLSTNTDKDWEYYGKTNPYYGVLTADDFLSRNLSPDAKARFFESGRRYVDLIIKLVQDEFYASFKPKRALDFGCGVGRLVIPLAEICETVTGVEISDSMIEEAGKNCSERGISNVKIVKGDDFLSLVSGTYDLVHSYIVFQHIAPHRGEMILKRLIGMLQDNGIGVLHFTYFSKESSRRKLLTAAYKHVPYLFGLRNILKGRPFSEPMMHMNEYDLNHIFRVLQEAGCHRCCTRFTDHNMYGIILLFQKKRLETL